MDDWRPIATVPKDGTFVLLYDGSEPAWAGNMEVGAWFGGDEEHACFWSAGGPNGGCELEQPFTLTAIALCLPPHRPFDREGLPSYPAWICGACGEKHGRRKPREAGISSGSTPGPEGGDPP